MVKGMGAVQETASSFENRLRKNARHRARWAARAGLTAYRLYDRDVPEYPFAVDWYAGRAHVVEYPRRRAIAEGKSEAQRAEVLEAVERVLELPPSRIYTKTHLPKPWGREQYGRAGEGSEWFTVTEQGLRFWVNLGDYLDTGLFLDHRLTRARVREVARGARFLNLFAYTAAFTVYAADGGARSTLSVDLSNTYCDWAARNLELNGFTQPFHRLIRSDAIRWVMQARAEGQQFDLVVVDPPTFSASKRMAHSFNVQRDHARLLRDVAELLAPGGALFFSTNFHGFQLDPAALSGLEHAELTPGTIPEDFHHRAHRCWCAKKPGAVQPRSRPIR
ncbi:MAG: class I SAM-dependent methyltransferase [Myxococcales bacterium]|nr:class I SAM-dependent methyltransferase [Myxococcales bacterium]